MKRLPVVQRCLGNEPEFAGERVARIITGNMRNGKAYRLPVLGPALRRLIGGAPAVTITTRSIDAETGPR